MNNDRLEALLWARVDGTIEAEELAELEAHLAEHPEPREIERQITTIAEELGHLDEVKPPPRLRVRIDGALATATPPTAHPTAAPRSHLTAAWPRRWLPLAASILIGIAIGYLVHPGAGGSIGRLAATGSMLNHAAPDAGRVEIQLAADAGSVVASRAGADVVVHVMLSREIEIDVTLLGTGGEVSFTGLESAGASATEISTQRDRVKVHLRGPGAATLSATAAELGDPLRLVVSVEGAPAEERWIGPGDGS